MRLILLKDQLLKIAQESPFILLFPVKNEELANGIENETRSN